MVTAQAVTLKDSMKGENRMVRKGFKMFLSMISIRVNKEGTKHDQERI